MQRKLLLYFIRYSSSSSRSRRPSNFSRKRGEFESSSRFSLGDEPGQISGLRQLTWAWYTAHLIRFRNWYRGIISREMSYFACGRTHLWLCTWRMMRSRVRSENECRNSQTSFETGKLKIPKCFLGNIIAHSTAILELRNDMYFMKINWWEHPRIFLIQLHQNDIDNVSIKIIRILFFFWVDLVQKRINRSLPKVSCVNLCYGNFELWKQII